MTERGRQAGRHPPADRLRAAGAGGDGPRGVRLRRRRRVGRDHPRRERRLLAAPTLPAADAGRRVRDRSVDDAARDAVAGSRWPSRRWPSTAWPIPTASSRPRAPRPRPACRSSCRRSSSRSIEEVAAAAPDATSWFQLYLQGAPGLSRSLVERAADGRLPRDRADRGPAGPRLSRAGPAVRVRAPAARQLRDEHPRRSHGRTTPTT